MRGGYRRRRFELPSEGHRTRRSTGEHSREADTYTFHHGDQRDQHGSYGRKGVTGTGLARQLTTLTREALEAGVAPGTERTTGSHMKYWYEFCDIMGVNHSTFGCVEHGVARPSLEQIGAEVKVFCTFATYIVHFPRARSRLGQSNSVTYAQQVISSVRTHYAMKTGRRPGLEGGNQGSGVLKRVLKGLSKIRPVERKVRFPILQHHLRAVKNTLDLRGTQMHRVLWALWLTQWQGVLRTGDLIRWKVDHRKGWHPARVTHRGRLTVDLGRDVNGAVVGARISLRLKPNKTDQSGIKGTVKTFIIDPSPESLSAGEAIRQMLNGDNTREGGPDVPLFRNPDTGVEVTYEESSAALGRALRRAGYPALATGAHSLRVGGATAYANSPVGGEIVAGFMGLWESNAKYDYLPACSPAVEAVGLAIGREQGMELAVRPGAVSRYACPRGDRGTQ